MNSVALRSGRQALCHEFPHSYFNAVTFARHRLPIKQFWACLLFPISSQLSISVCPCLLFSVVS